MARTLLGANEMKKFVRFVSLVTVIAFASLIGLAIHDLNMEREQLGSRLSKIEDTQNAPTDVTEKEKSTKFIRDIEEAISYEETRKINESLLELREDNEALTAKVAELREIVYRAMDTGLISYQEICSVVDALSRDFENQEVREDPSKLLSDLSPLIQLRISFTDERPTSDGRGFMSGWKEESLSGSIILWNGRHYILTAAHVPKNGGALTADCFFGDGRPSTSVELLGWSDKLDAAIFKFKDGYHYDGRTFELGQSSSLLLLSPVITLGSPGALTHGGNFSASYGYVMNPNFWSKHHRMSQPSAILHLAAANEGNSGGPLLDAHGKIVGVNFGTINQASFTSDGNGAIVQSKLETNLFLATSIDDIKPFFHKLTRKGKVSHGYIRGLMLEMASLLSQKELAKFGLEKTKNNVVVVVGVSRGSPAEKAGLRAGDIVKSVNGRALTSKYDLDRIAMLQEAGETATVGVFRKNEVVELKIKLDEYAHQLKPVIIK